MEKKKVKTRITVEKGIYKGFLPDGITLRDYDRETLDEIAKIFNGKVIRNYKTSENESEITAELTLIEGVKKIIIRIK